MCRQLFIWIVFIFAIAIAISGIMLPSSHLKTIIIVTNFFDIMLPILAVGALVNYMWKSCCCKKRQDT